MWTRSEICEQDHNSTWWTELWWPKLENHVTLLVVLNAAEVATRHCTKSSVEALFNCHSVWVCGGTEFGSILAPPVSFPLTSPSPPQVHCHKVLDKYVEFDAVILLLDVLLLRIQSFRHLIFNYGISFSVSPRLLALSTCPVHFPSTELSCKSKMEHLISASSLILWGVHNKRHYELLHLFKAEQLCACACLTDLVNANCCIIQVFVTLKLHECQLCEPIREQFCSLIGWQASALAAWCDTILWNAGCVHVVWEWD